MPQRRRSNPSPGIRNRVEHDYPVIAETREAKAGSLLSGSCHKAKVVYTVSYWAGVTAKVAVNDTVTVGPSGVMAGADS